MSDTPTFTLPMLERRIASRIFSWSGDATFFIFVACRFSTMSLDLETAGIKGHRWMRKR